MHVISYRTWTVWKHVKTEVGIHVSKDWMAHLKGDVKGSSVSTRAPGNFETSPIIAVTDLPSRFDRWERTWWDRLVSGVSIHWEPPYHCGWLGFSNWWLERESDSNYNFQMSHPLILKRRTALPKIWWLIVSFWVWRNPVSQGLFCLQRPFWDK